MSSSLNHAIYIQIKALVQSLSNKKTLRNTKTELLSLVEVSGPEARRYMLMCLFDSLDFKDPKVQNGAKEQTKTQFLTQHLTLCSSHSNFLDYFTQVIEHSLQKQSLTEYMNDVIKCLKLALPLQITMILSFTMSPTPYIAKEGLQMLKTKLNECLQIGKILQFPENILSSLLYVIKSNPELEEMSEEVKFLIETNGNDKSYDFKPLFVKGLENSMIPEAKDVTSLLKFTPTTPKLCDVLQDLGPLCSQSVQSLDLILADFPETNEEAILEALLMMHNYEFWDDEMETKLASFNEDVAKRAPEQRIANFAFQAEKTKLWSNMVDEVNEKRGPNVNWNVDNFIKVCSDRYPNLKWATVIKHLDRPNLEIRNTYSLLMLFKTFQKFKKFPTFTFPPSILFDRWKNPISQTDFLLNLIQIGQPESFFFNESPKRLVSLDLYPNLKISSLNPSTLQFFSCLDFLEILIELSESDYYVDIRTLFELPITRCPDLLILGLVQIKPTTGMPLLDELLSHLLPLYLSNHASSMEILEAIWRTNPQVMISAFSELYKRDNSSLNLSRVLDISQEIKDSLLPIVNCRDYSFSVSLGILAAKRDFLHLDQWIAKRIRSIGNPFISAIFKYLDEHIFEPCRTISMNQVETVLERSQLSLENLVIIFQTLMNPSLEGKMSNRNKLLLTERYKELAQHFPNIISDTPWTDIESTANSLFEQTFQEKLSIPELIEIMLKYKKSSNEKEKNILLCMMTNLLDEARFFVNYKPNILMIMAQIYGVVINNNLVEGQARDVTFKIIVESMKHPENRKQLEFGVTALQLFKGRLHEWPTKAIQLFSIENLREYYFDLLEEIRYNLESKGIQLDLPPEYLNYAAMRAQEKNRAMNKNYPPQNQRMPNMPNMPNMQGMQGMSGMPGMQMKQHDTMFQEPLPLLKGQLPPGYESRSPLLNQMPPGYLTGGYDPSSKDVAGRFSNSEIEEMSMGFKNISLNQPGMGQSGQPFQPPPMGPSSGFGQNLESFRTPGGLGGLGGGFGGFMMNEPSFGGPMNPYQGLTSQSPIPGMRNENPTSQVPLQGGAGGQPAAQQRAQPSQPVIPFDVLMKSFDKEFTDISDEWKNRVTFSLNNCSNNNIDEKALEIKAYLTDDKLVRWFSKYIVYQRAPIESNFHNMYVNLFNKMGKKEIFTYMTKETCALISKIIENDKISSAEKPYIQGNDKNSLKNLGSWLGLLTIGRNRPIILKDLDLKTMIIDAYDNNKLDYMLSLICKILGHGNQPGSVFKPKNAWMNALLSLLTEISQEKGLKLALKCEVQVLLKNFNLTEGDIIPSKILQLRKLQRRTMGLNQRPADFQGGQNDPNRLMGSNESQLIISELPQYVQVDAQTASIIPDIRNIVTQALDQAIKEILHLVILRSVTIAFITTKELVLKDFALEPDEKKLVKGATLIIQNLAGSLALVTCREPLKRTFQQFLKNILDQIDLSEKVREEIIQNTSMANLDLGCALIKRTVIEKALVKINEDPTIKEAIERRKRAREMGIPFYDENAIQIAESLPQALRPVPGGLTKDQMRIYEDFGKPAKPQEPRAQRGRRLERRLDPDSLAVVQRFEQHIFQFNKEVEAINEQQPNKEKFKELQIMHKRAMEMILHHGNTEDVPIECAIKVLEPIFSEQINFKKINYFLPALKDLKQMNQTVPSEVLQWILNPNEKHILKSDILIKLIRENCVNVPELDQSFPDFLAESNNSPQFSFNVIKVIKALTIDEKLLDPSHFQKTNDYIFKNSKNLKEFHPRMERFIEDYKAAVSATPSLNNQNTQKKTKIVQPVADVSYKATLQEALDLFQEKDADFYDQVYKKLEEWLRITSKNEMPAFIKVIETTIFQASGDTLIKFFAYMTDISVTNAINNDQRMRAYGKLHHNNSMDFSYVDAFSKLVILLLKTVININKNEILEKILHSIVLVLTKNHELYKKDFNQRPFFRLFENLLFDIRRREYNFTQQESTSFLTLFTKVFDTLQPLKYPGFAFSWLELISSRNFMPLIILNNQNKTENWRNYAQLFVSLFKFFNETMEGENYKSESYQLFYKGTLMSLLVLLHDFPEFLIEASFLLVENLPEKFNQVRNIIFSALPQTRPLPDPFLVNDQIQLKEEFKTLPTYLYNFDERVINIKLHEEIVKYLTAKNDVNEIYFRNICSKFLTKNANGEVTINQPVINAFVLFVPCMIYKSNEDKKIHDWKMASYSLFYKLLLNSNYQMRKSILNSIINQISYPNPITFYFTNLIFDLFSPQQTDETLQEQIMKIFIERLITDRPHPWGIMYTFIQLLKEKDIFRKKSFSKNSDFEDVIKLVFKAMKKGDATEDEMNMNVA